MQSGDVEAEASRVLLAIEVGESCDNLLEITKEECLVEALRDVPTRLETPTEKVVDFQLFKDLAYVGLADFCSVERSADCHHSTDEMLTDCARMRREMSTDEQ